MSNWALQISLGIFQIAFIGIMYFGSLAMIFILGMFYERNKRRK